MQLDFINFKVILIKSYKKVAFKREFNLFKVDFFVSFFFRSIQ